MCLEAQSVNVSQKQRANDNLFPDLWMIYPNQQVDARLGMKMQPATSWSGEYPKTLKGFKPWIPENPAAYPLLQEISGAITTTWLTLPWASPCFSVSRHGTQTFPIMIRDMKNLNRHVDLKLPALAVPHSDHLDSVQIGESKFRNQITIEITKTPSLHPRKPHEITIKSLENHHFWLINSHQITATSS